MRSRGELRRWLEWLLRASLVTILTVALWRSMEGSRAGFTEREARVETLPTALRDATRSASIGAIDLTVDATLSPAEREWLVALRRAGVSVRWHGTPPALALSVERAREPVAPIRFRLTAAGGTPVVLADSIGAIDTLRMRDGVGAMEAADVVGLVRARRGSFAATAETPAAGARRAVLVLGRAGWESSFVITALTEAGWEVRARLPAAPGVAVTDAGVLPIDSARYDAVVALDSTAADLGPVIARFVAQGGGLVAAGTALGIGALRRVLPAGATARRSGPILLDGDTVTLASLPIRPLIRLRSDAVALETQAAGIATAIRRAGRGRVAAVGYDESWRWRMQGGESGAAEHRAWWSHLVGLVAPERAAEDVASGASVDAAPLAALVEALGPPSRAPSRASASPSRRLPLLLLAAAAAALLAETMSRRFRGAR
jgi:hypothetical protein